jgi:hypothetical protein
MTTTRPRARNRSSRKLAEKPSLEGQPHLRTDLWYSPGHQVGALSIFRFVFTTIVALTVFSGMASLVMAFAIDNIHPQQQAIFESMNNTWKLGFGAILGLLGGKLT